MRVFITGATGLIGSALLPELVRSGHQVVGLGRSSSSVEKITAAGAEAILGDLEDVELLRRAASEADAVFHLAFDHDFSKFQKSSETDKKAIEAFGSALKGSIKPLFVSIGMPLNAPAYPVSETFVPLGTPASPRVSEETALSLRDQGVNVNVIRLPQVHSTVKQGLTSFLRVIAQSKGVSVYVGDGSKRWSAAHALDVAHLYRLALEAGGSNKTYHAVAEEGVTLRSIAEAIAKRDGIPTTSIQQEEAMAHFGFFGQLVTRDLSATSALTRQQLQWTPTRPGLVQDLEDAE